MSKDEMKLMMDDVEKLVKEFVTKKGFTLNGIQGRYNASELKINLVLVKKGQLSSEQIKRENAYKIYAPLDGLNTEINYWFTTEVNGVEQEVQFIGYDTRKKKYPYILESRDKKRYKLSSTQAKTVFANKV